MSCLLELGTPTWGTNFRPNWVMFGLSFFSCLILNFAGYPSAEADAFGAKGGY